MVINLATDAAPQPHLMHDLKHDLISDADTIDGSQPHRYLAETDAVGGLPSVSAPLARASGVVEP